MTVTREQRAAALAELPKHETRTSTLKLEVRAADTTEADNGAVVVEGYASVWDEPYYYGGTSAADAYFTEYVRKGAFTKTIRESDIRLLIEHGGLAIARNTVTGQLGKLTITEDDHGLHIRAELDPADPDVQRLAPKLRSGVVSGMSFGFRVIRQNIIEDPTTYAVQRDLEEVALDEVSIVTFPAYTGTEVGVRALDQEALTAALDEARAGKALSAENARLIKAAAEALTQLLEKAAPADVAPDEAVAQDAEQEPTVEPPTEPAAPVETDPESPFVETVRSSAVTLAQFRRSVEVVRLRRR